MFDLFRNIVRQIPGRIGSLLFGIGEYAQSFEPYRAHEFQKLFEVGFGFARISDQQGRAQREVGNGLPQFVDQFVSLGLGMASVHGRELVVGDMLEGNVEVFADFGFAGHHFDHLVGESRGVGVVEPDPADAVDAAQGFEQFGQASFAVKVQAVVGRVLCDYDQFAHTPAASFRASSSRVSIGTEAWGPRIRGMAQ